MHTTAALTGLATMLVGTGPWLSTCAGINVATAQCLAPLAGSGIAGRPVPEPIYGITLDDVSNPAAELASLRQMAQVPTVRIVFDAGQDVLSYPGPIQQFHGSAYIMGGNYRIPRI
jgi:pheromone shutdown protein TraB